MIVFQVVHDKAIIVVEDAKDAVVNLQLTEPFFCDAPGCFFDLQVYIPNTDECSLSSLAQTRSSTPCGIHVFNDSIGKNLTITLKNLGNQNFEEIKNQFFLLLKTDEVENDAMFSNISLPPIKVSLTYGYSFDHEKCALSTEFKLRHITKISSCLFLPTRQEQLLH